MKNVSLTEYVKKVYAIECFIYQQELIIYRINNKIEKNKNVKLKSAISDKADNYPDFYSKAKTRCSVIVYVLLMIVTFFLSRDILSKVNYIECISKLWEGTYLEYIASLPFIGRLLAFVTPFVVVFIVIPIVFILFILFDIAWPIGWVLMFGILSIPICLVMGKLLFCVPIKRKRDKYTKDYKAYADNKNVAIRKNNEALMKRNRMIINSLIREKNIVKDSLESAKKIRQNYYDMNIIHKDYRGLISTGCFYHYLDTGICDSLEGTNGAYNLFRTDCYRNRKIQLLVEANKKLDTMIDQLGDLIHEVGALNAGISSIRSRVNYIDMKMNDSLQRMERIDDNLDVISYNSELNNSISAFAAGVSMYNSKLIDEIRRQ